jgi:hypothetical protein
MDFSSFEEPKKANPDKDVTPCGLTPRDVCHVLIRRFDELGIPYEESPTFWHFHQTLCNGGVIIVVNSKPNDPPPKKKRSRKSSGS